MTNATNIDEAKNSLHNNMSNINLHKKAKLAI